MTAGSFHIGDKVTLSINSALRDLIKANHTATHLLQAALRKILGDHIVQKGSYIDNERLRFDFSHNGAISPDDLKSVERFINRIIEFNFPVYCETMPKQAAINTGATALFGEKYEDTVRTIRIVHPEKESISFELCGGTHVKSTGEIGLFKIISEASIGAGIRRIEAITKPINILKYIEQKEQLLEEAAAKLKCSITDIPERIDSLMAGLKKINQELHNQKCRYAFSQMKKVQNTKEDVFTFIVEDFSVEELRLFNDFARAKQKEGIFIILSKNSENKMSIVVSTGDNSNIKASEIIKPGLEILQGRGGGKAALAQGGGLGHNTEAVIQAICEAL